MGIPCIHTIKEFFESTRPLKKAHFHPQWHLDSRPDEVLDPRLFLLEPKVSRSRGRPAGATNQDRSTRRDASGFEHELGIGPADGTQGRRPRGRPRLRGSGRGRDGGRGEDEGEDEDRMVLRVKSST
ncbi:hypothetical protein V8E54_002955 [Elaphomyces granulatus]